MSKVNRVKSSNTIINDRLLVTARVLEKTGNLLFNQFGITVRTYEIITHIHAGENTTVKLASLLQSSLANITHKTKLLEKQGYVQRMLDHNDKRVWYFSLTSRGKQALKTIRHLYEQATEKLYNQFSKQQKKEILHFLHVVEEHLKKVSEDKKLIKAFVMSTVTVKNILKIK